MNLSTRGSGGGTPSGHPGYRGPRWWLGPRPRKRPIPVCVFRCPDRRTPGVSSSTRPTWYPSRDTNKESLTSNGTHVWGKGLGRDLLCACACTRVCAECPSVCVPSGALPESRGTTGGVPLPVLGVPLLESRPSPRRYSVASGLTGPGARPTRPGTRDRVVRGFMSKEDVPTGEGGGVSTEGPRPGVTPPRVELRFGQVEEPLLPVPATHVLVLGQGDEDPPTPTPVRYSLDSTTTWRDGWWYVGRVGGCRGAWRVGGHARPRRRTGSSVSVVTAAQARDCGRRRPNLPRRFRSPQAEASWGHSSSSLGRRS